MTKTMTYLLGMLITILVGIWLYMTLCSTCMAPVAQAPVSEPVLPVQPEATSFPFALTDGDFAYNVNDNYNFNTSSTSILMPLSQKVSDGVASLKAYFGENPGKVIDITGYYRGDEENNTAYPNLGLARANAVKNHLVQNGIPSAQINTIGKLMDDMVPKDGIYLGPVAYHIHGKSATADDELKALYEKIKADPLVLYFDTAESAITLSAAQRQKFADISRYLDKMPDASAQIVGHTDNTGDSNTNMSLGQKRADFAKAYLMRNGISETKINAVSRGSKDPIASNATEEGKAKNRRTVITLN
ncbi:MAG: OmpA family protein [Bacteroidota bacterium]